MANEHEIPENVFAEESDNSYRSNLGWGVLYFVVVVVAISLVGDQFHARRFVIAIAGMAFVVGFLFGFYCFDKSSN